MYEELIYSGAFVSAEKLYQKFPPALGRKVAYPHVTFKFRPTLGESWPALFGLPVRIEVIGYGCNQRNEGLQVKVSAANKVLQKFVAAIAVPHITLATAEGAAPADTAKLDFQPLAEPFVITGTYGGFTGKEVITSSVGACVEHDRVYLNLL